MIRAITSSVAVLMITFLAYGVDCAAQHAAISVRGSPDPSGMFPASRLYVAELRTDVLITVEAIQMPGGYVGSGTFFHCSVEKWDNGRKRWRVVHKNDLSQFHNPDIQKIEIKPGGMREVCRALLPHDGGSRGDRVRFRLGYTWRDFGQSTLSDSFVIEDKDSTSLKVSPR
jgi:hypothetical protein